ncbi:MAG: 50S ribosomal protein L17 [Bdellovibrionales bacterium]|nr:50S ribosomal protein L17 [Bdellovibrionales bacterium]
MRHKVDKHTFGRRQGARKALIRGLVDALVEHGRIKTTLPKAKELRRYVEKAITMGKKGDLNSRRVLLSKYPNQSTVKTIVDDLSKRFMDRPGGYTRIIKAGYRTGDMAPMALIEFVDYERPAAVSEETVKGATKEEVAKKKAIAQRAEAKRKNVRKMQALSRKRNRS